MGEFENPESYETPRERVDDRFDGGHVVFLLAGIAIGAGLALLLTPKRGREVRAVIGRGCRRVADELSDRSHDLREEIRERGEHLKEDLRQRADALRERAGDFRDRAPDLLRFRRTARRRERPAREA